MCVQSTEAVGQNPELVLQPSQLPRHMMVPNNSMFTYPQREGPAIPKKRLAAPKNSVASFQNPSGDLPQYYGTHVRGLTPVQDSQHDTSRSRIHLSRPPMPLSPTFLKYGQSMHEDALNGGVTPGSSRKLHDLVRDYRDQSEQLRIAKESIARSDKYSCDLKTQLAREREESDGAARQQESKVALLVSELEKMELENSRLKTNEHKLKKGYRSTLEQNRQLKADIAEKERIIEEMEMERAQRERIAVENSTLLEEQDRVRKLCLKHYDATLELEYEFTVVLDDKKVKEEFKKKVRELKKEVEGRKNATWP